ncbi:MAG TPA: hypothetical protein VLK65_18760 [Vicinamibacteria bacterium]|nr:hypothetical protein [Vicinamibacteria bacterium]
MTSQTGRARISPQQLGAALALSTGLLVVNLLPNPGLPVADDDAPGLDAHVYLAMAESPLTFTRAPYAYRLGVPLVVHWLPFPHETSFLALTLGGLLLTMVLGYTFFRVIGFDHVLGLLGVTFLGTAPEIPIYLGNHFLVDPLALTSIALLLLAIERGLDDGPMALLLLVSTLIKESAFFVVPVLYLRLSGAKVLDLRAAWRTVAVSIPAIVAALILRFWWVPDLVLFPYLTPWSVDRDPWFGSMESYQALWRGLFSYLALLAVANAFDTNWRLFARRYSPYALLVAAQLIVPMNQERLFYFAFPVVVSLALVEFERLRYELPQWAPLLITILVFCYLFVPDQPAYPIAIVILGRLLIERRRTREESL